MSSTNTLPLAIAKSIVDLLPAKVPDGPEVLNYIDIARKAVRAPKAVTECLNSPDGLRSVLALLDPGWDFLEIGYARIEIIRPRRALIS